MFNLFKKEDKEDKQEIFTRLFYKCRMCGEKYEQISKGFNNPLIESPPYESDKVIVSHNTCEAAQFGIADLIGYNYFKK